MFTSEEFLFSRLLGCSRKNLNASPGKVLVVIIPAAKIPQESPLALFLPTFDFMDRMAKKRG